LLPVLTTDRLLLASVEHCERILPPSELCDIG